MDKWRIYAAYALLDRALAHKWDLPPNARSAIKAAHYQLTIAKQSLK